jgi:signal recognition particle subunit SRP54
MFKQLTQSFSEAFRTLKGEASFSQSNLVKPLKQIRDALIDADVAFDIVTECLDSIKQQALGQPITPGVKPEEAFAKLVHDALIDMLGGSVDPKKLIDISGKRPVHILLAGTQGVGKTTSLAKLGKWLQKEHKVKVMVASADIYRAAALDQLEHLAKQADLLYYDASLEDSAAEITEKAMQACQEAKADILIMDTAGRSVIDEQMMQEIQTIQQILSPQETLFVVDSMTGQVAVDMAKAFKQALDQGSNKLTGVILSKTDGDSHGGAALSVRAITGCPIKFMGTGEHIADLDYFDGQRLTSKILGMGDIIALVRKAEETIDQKEAERSAKKMAKGLFDLEDYQSQIDQMMKMGGMQGMLSMMPGMSKMGDMASKMINDDTFKHHKVMIQSMTARERHFPALIKQKSRQRRVAKGSGHTVNEVGQLLKQYEKMKKMMDQMRSGKMKKMMQAMGQKMPDFPSDLFGGHPDK